MKEPTVYFINSSTTEYGKETIRSSHRHFAGKCFVTRIFKYICGGEKAHPGAGGLAVEEENELER